MNDYMPFLGVFVQWLRSVVSGKWRDIIIVAVLFAACGAAGWLEGEDMLTREAWGIHGGVLDMVLKVLGVTFVVSKGADVAVAMGANPDHAAIPATKDK